MQRIVTCYYAFCLSLDPGSSASRNSLRTRLRLAFQQESIYSSCPLPRMGIVSVGLRVESFDHGDWTQQHPLTSPLFPFSHGVSTLGLVQHPLGMYPCHVVPRMERMEYVLSSV